MITTLKQRAAKREYYAANRKRLLAYASEFSADKKRHQTAEQRERERERERKREYMRKWRAGNGDKVLAHRKVESERQRERRAQALWLALSPRQRREARRAYYREQWSEWMREDRCKEEAERIATACAGQPVADRECVLRGLIAGLHQ